MIDSLYNSSLQGPRKMWKVFFFFLWIIEYITLWFNNQIMEHMNSATMQYLFVSPIHLPSFLPPGE